MESPCRVLGKIDLEFQIPQPVEVQKYPPPSNRCAKGVRFLQPLSPGLYFLAFGLVLRHIDSDAAPVPSSVSSGKQKYTQFEDNELYQKSPGRVVDRGDGKC